MQNKIVEKLCEVNFRETLNQKQGGQLDDFLKNNPVELRNRDTENKFNISFLSLHESFTVKIELRTEFKCQAEQHRSAFNNFDCKESNTYKQKSPFKRFRYIHIDELVKQWYKRLDNVSTKNILKTTLRGANLPLAHI